MNPQTPQEQPLVSVILPVYNRSIELARAISSVLNQTYQNFEILVIDDGSEEDLRIVCDSFNDNRIKFIKNEKHTNANVARNKGIKEAKGEYIAMLDSDDEYLPYHLMRRIEKINEWECDGIYGSAYINDGDNLKLKYSRECKENETFIDYLLTDGFCPTPSHFYKNVCAKEILFNENYYRHQDYDFSIRFQKKYIFRNDGKPTVTINWHKNDKRKFRLADFKNFIEDHLHYASTEVRYLYLKNICILLQHIDKVEYDQLLKTALFNKEIVSWNDFAILNKYKNLNILKRQILKFRFILGITFSLFNLSRNKF